MTAGGHEYTGTSGFTLGTNDVVADGLVVVLTGGLDTATVPTVPLKLITVNPGPSMV